MAIHSRIHPCNRFFRTIRIKQSVFMQEKIIMFPLTDKFHDIFQEFSIFLTALFAGSLLCILLQSPDSPKQHIRMLHFINLVPDRLFIDKVTNRFFCRFHHVFKLVNLINSECQTRQSNEHITCTTFEPGITGKNIMLTFLFVMELMGRVLQTVVETVTWRTVGHFRLKGLFQFTRSCF